MYAHHASAVPSWTFDRTALAHVRSVPLFFTLLTTVFAPVVGASADTKATSKVFAAGMIDGLVIVVLEVLRFRTTVAAMTGPAVAAGPVEMTNATALPVGTLAPATGY